jgi:hypothetical protein
LYNYTVTTGDHIFAAITKLDKDFVSTSYDLGYYPNSSVISSMFRPSVPIANYDFHSSAHQTLMLFRRKATEPRPSKPRPSPQLDKTVLPPTKQVTTTDKPTKKQRPSKLRSKHKCKIMKCPGHPNEHHHVQCSNMSCTKRITRECFTGILSAKRSIAVEGDKMYCTVACHKASKKKDNEVQRDWAKDGLNGPEDPNNSLRYLIGWLLAPGNYDKWRGGKFSSGRTKLSMAKEIGDYITRKGTK